jgi:hypothetical protein
MDTQMTAKRKPTTPKKKPEVKKVYIHKCSQKEVLARMSEILVGDGHPEQGLAFRFSEFMQDHKKVLESIDDIKEGVKGLHTRADDNAKAAATAMSAINQYKKECEVFDQGAKETEDKILLAQQLLHKNKQDNWQKVIWVIMALLALYGIFRNNKTSDSNSKKIDNLGTPYVSNPRGEPVQLEKGTTVRMWPKDFNGADTTKKADATSK